MQIGDTVIYTTACKICRGDRVGMSGVITGVHASGRYKGHYLSLANSGFDRHGKERVEDSSWLCCDGCCRLARVDEINKNRDFVYGE